MLSGRSPRITTMVKSGEQMIAIFPGPDRTTEELIVDGQVRATRTLDRGLSELPISTDKVGMETLNSQLRAPGEPMPEFEFSTVLGTCETCFRGVWLVDKIVSLGSGYVGRCQGCKDKQEKPFVG